MPVLRKAKVSHAFLADVWRKARAEHVPRGANCPLCGLPMAKVQTSTSCSEMTLDVCPSCPAIWFDALEYQAVGHEPPPVRMEARMSPEQREKYAILRVQQMAQQEQEADPLAPPDEFWQWLPGLLGLPVELDPPPVKRRPVLTWGLIVACMLATIPLWFGSTFPASPAIREWGFIPAEWDRAGYLTFITSFFLHASPFHLLANMYFLFVFGDNVEDWLGPAGYLVLLAAAHISGLLVHTIFSPDLNIPCVGASAGISGVIALYAIAFPNVRLALMLRWLLIFQWFRIRAAWALVLYVLMQALGIFLQMNGIGSNVAYLAHVGGLAVGVAIGLAAAFVPTRPGAAN